MPSSRAVCRDRLRQTAVDECVAVEFFDLAFGECHRSGPWTSRSAIEPHTPHRASAAPASTVFPLLSAPWRLDLGSFTSLTPRRYIMSKHLLTVVSLLAGLGTMAWADDDKQE